MEKLAIKTEGLTKIYREVTKGGLIQKTKTGLEDLEVRVKEGEVYAFLGPNGAGKTTTIKLLTRLMHATRGRIWIFNRLNNSRLSMEKVGYLPEQPNLYGYLTGIELLDLMARIYGLNSKIRKKRITELIEIVGLRKQAEVLIRSYSRGMVQRLGLAQALINDPSLLILDEPMSNLDPFGRKDFRDLILKLKTQGKTIFFSSHILSDAEMIADRVAILNHGKLVNEGKLDELVDSQILSIDVTFIVEPDKILQFDSIPEKKVIQDNKVMICLKNEHQVNDLIKQINTLGGKLISVIPHRKNLEDVFITEIGR
jgi:ABC-2 type transport system ATP-binding protein